MIFTFYVKAVCTHVDGEARVDFPPAPTHVVRIEARDKDEARQRVFDAITQLVDGEAAT